MMRKNQRKVDEIRNLSITHQFTKYAEGSVLISLGDTKVVCTASVSQEVPKFIKHTDQGWLTAEYSMLPRSTHIRINRESIKGKPSGRTYEIQRLIGRALRAVINLQDIPGITIKIDCDVLQADGGTRTAAITGAGIAVYDAVQYIKKNNLAKSDAKVIHSRIAAISVGMYQGSPILDLDYEEDSNADTDMNIVMTDNFDIIEVQGTAEGNFFSTAELTQMVTLGKKGIKDVFTRLY